MENKEIVERVNSDIDEWYRKHDIPGGERKYVLEFTINDENDITVYWSTGTDPVAGVLNRAINKIRMMVLGEKGKGSFLGVGIKNSIEFIELFFMSTLYAYHSFRYESIPMGYDWWVEDYRLNVVPSLAQNSILKELLVNIGVIVSESGEETCSSSENYYINGENEKNKYFGILANIFDLNIPTKEEVKEELGKDKQTEKSIEIRTAWENTGKKGLLGQKLEGFGKFNMPLKECKKSGTLQACIDLILKSNSIPDKMAIDDIKSRIEKILGG
jgi:hypothetical protein